MKQKYALCVFFIFCCCFILRAQEQDSIKSNNPGYLLSISPAALIDISDGSSVRLNAEIPLYKNITVGTEGGMYIGLANYKEQNRGYLIKPVLKYYIGNRNGKMRYIGLEYMYKKQDYNLTDSLDIDNVHVEKAYSMHRITNSISLKYGQISQLGHKFFIEYYAGLGIRYLNSISSLTPEEENSVLTGRDNINNVDYGDSMMKGAARESGKMIYPNLVLGFKIGFKIE